MSFAGAQFPRRAQTSSYVALKLLENLDVKNKDRIRQLESPIAPQTIRELSDEQGQFGQPSEEFLSLQVPQTEAPGSGLPLWPV
jgi:hypothetical protein